MLLLAVHVFVFQTLRTIFAICAEWGIIDIGGLMVNQADKDPRYFDLSKCDREIAWKLLELNEVIAEVVFGFDRSGEPVHLDMDDEAIELMSNRLIFLKTNSKSI